MISLIRGKTTWKALPLLTLTGIEQMALDEALLEWARLKAPDKPLLIVRGYQWLKPTLSLGTHQTDRLFPIEAMPQLMSEEFDLVRRPTGGRAILHDAQDLSVSFVATLPHVVHAPLADSYCLFNTWVRKTLQELNVPLHSDCTVGNRDYLASNLCFETKTPSDLITTDGQKVFGAAQLRRENGILQHGSIRLEHVNASPKFIVETLLNQIEQDLGCGSDPLLPEADSALNAQWIRLQEIFSGEASQTLSRLSTTSGSHLVPASD